MMLTSTLADAADEVRITALSDVAFGTITSLTSDLVRSETVCVYAKSPPGNNYRITGSGSGAGGTFLLSSGSSTLAYEVQWSDTPGQTSGTQLTANQPLSAQHSTSGSGHPDDCSGDPLTASLVVILRSTSLGAATAGIYTGTLTLLVAPE